MSGDFRVSCDLALRSMRLGRMSIVAFSFQLSKYSDFEFWRDRSSDYVTRAFEGLIGMTSSVRGPKVHRVQMCVGIGAKRF